MRHGMDITKGCIVKCNSRQVLGISHLIPGFHVISIGNCLGKVVGNHLNGHDGRSVCQRIGIRGHISFNGMGQRIHARGCCQ